MPSTTPLSLLYFLLLTLLTITKAKDTRHVIKFKSPSLYPEGLTYDPSSQHFILSSLTSLSLHSLSDASVIEPLPLTPPLSAPSTTLGLAVDRHRNRLLAAVNIPSSGGPHLASLSLSRSSVELIFLSPLTNGDGNGLANGVTVDRHGNAYITNSNDNFIWKVDVNGSSSVLSNSSLFSVYPVDRSSPYSYCGLNGLVYVPTKGYLLVVQSNTGKLYKVDVEDGTARTVDLPEDLTLGDGMAIREDGVVIVVSMNRAWYLKSDDSWSRAAIIDKVELDREGFPTSVTIGGGGRAYVVYGYVEEGMKGNGEREWFRIEEIRSESESQGETWWPFVLIGLGLVYVVFWRFQMGLLVKNMDKKTN